MNNTVDLTKQNDVQENVVAGIVGAFLFALAGGIIWFVFYLLGFIVGISGLVGAVCAIKGYSIFAKKESIKGIIISVILAALVIVMAWYFCLAYDVCSAYKSWYEEGIIDYTVTYFEAVQGARYFLSDPEIGPAYYGDLAIGLLFCVAGAGSYVFNKIKNIKQKAAQPVAAAPVVTAEADASATEVSETEETKSTDGTNVQ